MARNYRSQSRSSRTPNRAWAHADVNAFTAVAAASKVLLGGFTLSNTNIDETILRTVGRLAVSTDNPVGDEEQIGAFGMILVSDAAVAVGVTAIPGPITDGQDDGWFVYVPIVQRYHHETSVGFDPQFATGYDFDSKAKRVVEEGRQMAIMVENAHATHAFDIAFVLRLLSVVRGT